MLSFFFVFFRLLLDKVPPGVGEISGIGEATTFFLTLVPRPRFRERAAGRGWREVGRGLVFFLGTREPRTKEESRRAPDNFSCHSPVSSTG